MKIKRFLAAFSAVAMSAVIAVPTAAFADDTTTTTTTANYKRGNTTTTTTSSGETTTTPTNTSEDVTGIYFTKYLVMDKEANVPNVEFSYTISKYDPSKSDGVILNQGDNSRATYTVFNGVGSPVITNVGSGTTTAASGSVTFTSSDTTYNEDDYKTSDDATDMSGKDKGHVEFITKDDEKDEKYARQDVSIDFSKLNFDEPGIYRYVITESVSGTNQGVTNDSIADRTLDIYVEWKNESDTSKGLQITGYNIYDGKVSDSVANTTNSANGESDTSAVSNATKDPYYTNSYDSSDLTFGKEVTGNQGSKDKYFKFTVTISGATENTKYTVITANADTAPEVNSATNKSYTADVMGNANNVTELTASTKTDNAATYEVTHDFYLHDGQYITIQGLAKGTTYTITENEEDYTKTDGITAAISTFDKDNDGTNDALSGSTSGLIASEDVYTGFTNEKDGVIPTGIILSVAPYAAAGIVIVGAIVFLVIRSKRKAQED